MFDDVLSTYITPKESTTKSIAKNNTDIVILDKTIITIDNEKTEKIWQETRAILKNIFVSFNFTIQASLFEGGEWI